MQVVICQTDIVWEDKAANHRRVRDMLSNVDIEPGALVVVPEMFAVGFSMNVAAIAEDVDGPTHVFLSQLAKDLGAFVLGGVVTRAADGRGRNEAVTFDPQGKLLGRYAKTHPFTPAGESANFEAGSDVVTVRCGEFTLAPLVCYDLRFPEVFRRAVRRGADLMVVMASWPSARIHHWLALLRARAIENQCYVVGVNRVGVDPNVQYNGHSLIVSPSGETVAEAGENPQVLAATIELEPLQQYRRQFPFLADIRDDFD